ncbi:MAG: type pilus assembly protein PilN [Pseudomonadota bacterium]|nr:type pilus assembly protein PilN [Pseudomonadota bacterium]
MVKINLLPWRETQQKEKQQRFLIALSVSLIFVFSTFVFVHLHIARQKAFQIKRNTMLQNEITQQDQIIVTIKNMDEKTRQITDKINYINTLRKTRLETLDVLNQLSVAIPHSVYLTKLTRTNQKIIIEGKAQSSGALSEFMHNIDNETLFQSTVLETMTTPDDARIENIKSNQNIPLFTFHTQQHNEN